MKLENLVTPRQLAERCPALDTEDKVRWLIRNADRYGIADAIHRLGSKVMIDEVAFLDALAKQGR